MEVEMGGAKHVSVQNAAEMHLRAQKIRHATSPLLTSPVIYE
jgi:hypothetical protein